MLRSRALEGWAPRDQLAEEENSESPYQTMASEGTVFVLRNPFDSREVCWMESIKVNKATHPGTIQCIQGLVPPKIPCAAVFSFG